MKKIVIVLIACLSVFAASAQQGKKFDESTTWHWFVYVDYHTGKYDRAMEIIENHFKTASDKAGTPKPEMYHMMSGDYDLIVVWTIENGPADLNWDVHPNSEKWMKAFNEQEGGAENGKAIRDEYNSLVRNAYSELVIKK